MNKSELITAITQKTDFSKKDVDIIVTHFTETIKEELAKNNKVKIAGFGIFEPSLRSSRRIKHPKTGNDLFLDETILPKFKPSKAFKDMVLNKNINVEIQYGETELTLCNIKNTFIDYWINSGKDLNDIETATLYYNVPESKIYYIVNETEKGAI